MKMTFQEIRIIVTGPCIANQLRDVNTICRNIKKSKMSKIIVFVNVWRKNIFDIYVTEYGTALTTILPILIEVGPLIINFSTELTTVVKFEVKVQKWCGRSCIGGFFNFQLWRIYQWKKFCTAIYQLLLHIVFTSRNWFVMQGPVAIILICWNVVFIWETGYWTRAMKRLSIVYNLFCRDGIYFDKILVSEY
jgi:ABC-type proline/glycine betaine transport system permease subunit